TPGLFPMRVLTITPSGFVDLTLRTTSLVLAPAPSAQGPSADTTFTISSVKLSRSSRSGSSGAARPLLIL
ncbi:hypothetical protein TNCT_724431, partial [Trichonephila clavata]